VFDYARFSQLCDELERKLEEEPDVPDPWRSFRNCEHCGEEMLTWRLTQKHCSKECRGAAERKARNYPIEEWCRLYEAGTPYNKIASQYNVSYGCVRRNIQAAGVPPRTDHAHFARYRGQSSHNLYRWEKVDS